MEQAVWGLGNISGDSPKLRDIIINAGAVQPIADLLDRALATASDGFIKNLSWTLSNFCRGRPVSDHKKIRRAVPSLARVLMSRENEDILTDICWAFSYICDSQSKETLPYIVETNVLPRIVELLRHQHLPIIVSCLRSCGNILTGEES